VTPKARRPPTPARAPPRRPLPPGPGRRVVKKNK
jgi:hypothetical protein